MNILRWTVLRKLFWSAKVHGGTYAMLCAGKDSLPDVLRFNFIFYPSIAVPVWAVWLAVHTFTFFFPVVNALQAISLILENILGDSLLS